MNWKQKTTIVIGILLMVVSWMFPYYQYNTNAEWTFYEPVNSLSRTERHFRFSGETNEAASKLYPELLVAALMTAGGVLLFKRKSHA